MVHAICPLYRFIVPRVHTFDAAQIDATLTGVHAAFVMCVDATGFAEIVLGSVGVPTIKRQVVRAL